MNSIKILVLDVDGTLTDGGIYIDSLGNQMRRFNVKDGRGIVNAQKAGIEVAIISGSKDRLIIEKRAEMLNINKVYVGEENKALILEAWMSDMGISWENVAFVGDDVNDLPIIDKAALSACPSDAVDEVKDTVNCILKRAGGAGCVREFVDLHLLA